MNMEMPRSSPTEAPLTVAAVTPAGLRVPFLGILVLGPSLILALQEALLDRVGRRCTC